MACNPLGPGPGAYQMPTTVGYPGHDPTRLRNPMYSMGGSGTYRMCTTGPGPIYKIERMTREGNVCGPAWSFGARFPTRCLTLVPGPGAHAPENCQSLGPRAPAYSLGMRTGYCLKKTGPGPNAYNLCGGPGGPAYSMGARRGYCHVNIGPGPANYFQQNLEAYKTKGACWSLGTRNECRKGPIGPGPASYPPDMYDSKKCPPKFSFGTKHSCCAPPLIIPEDTMDCL